MYPVYQLYMKDGDKFLLAAKKRPKQKTSNYLISASAEALDRDSEHFLGKLRSNFVGTGTLLLLLLLLLVLHWTRYVLLSLLLLTECID